MRLCYSGLPTLTEFAALCRAAMTKSRVMGMVSKAAAGVDAITVGGGPDADYSDANTSHGDADSDDGDLQRDEVHEEDLRRCSSGHAQDT